MGMRWREGWPVRALAGLTVGYSVAITVAPRLLARPCGLTRPDGSVATSVAALTRSIGTRDAVLAGALALAPAGYPMTLLTAARALADVADAVWLGRMVPEQQRGKVAGAAAGWAALEIIAAAVGNRRGG